MRSRSHLASSLSALAFVTAALAASRASAAESFRYTDRSGQTHLIPVSLLPVTSLPDSPEPPDTSAPLAAAPPARRDAPMEPPAILRPDPPAPPTRALFARADAVDTLAAAPLAPSPFPLPPPAALDPATVPHADLVREAAAYYTLPVALLLAVIQVESRFHERAVSRKGALGLMQLMPTTAQDLGVADPFDPRQNIFGGARHLRALLNEFDGRVTLAVAAYNAGAGAVRRASGVPPIPETQSYVPAVLALYRAYQARLAPAPAPESPTW